MQEPNSNILLRISLLFNLLTLLVGLGLVYWLGGFKHFFNRIKNRGLSEEYAMKSSELEVLPDEEKDIIFLGNSLIANGSWHEWFIEYEISNQGIRGDGVEGVMKRIPKIAKSNPKYLFLLIGINDLAFHDKSWLLEKYTLLLKQLKVQLPDTKVFVQSILPVNNHVKHTGYTNKDISLFNRDLEKLVKGTNNNYIDLWNLFSNNDGNLKADWTLDGLHLTGEAYLNWANFLKRSIESIKTG